MACSDAKWGTVPIMIEPRGIPAIVYLNNARLVVVCYDGPLGR